MAQKAGFFELDLYEYNNVATLGCHMHLFLYGFSCTTQIELEPYARRGTLGAQTKLPSLLFAELNERRTGSRALHGHPRNFSFSLRCFLLLSLFNAQVIS